MWAFLWIFSSILLIKALINIKNKYGHRRSTDCTINETRFLISGRFRICKRLTCKLKRLKVRLKKILELTLGCDIVQLWSSSSLWETQNCWLHRLQIVGNNSCLLQVVSEHLPFLIAAFLFSSASLNLQPPSIWFASFFESRKLENVKFWGNWATY